MALGDLSALKALSVDVGSVFKMTLSPKDGIKPKKDGDISRDKYFVIIGKAQDSVIIGSLLINSEINDRLFTLIGPYQHCIYPDQYEFLNGKERYIDCYKIKEFEYIRILQDAEYIGHIDSNDIYEAINLSKSSPANNNQTLKKFDLL